jgi:hypothetical protein
MIKNNTYQYAKMRTFPKSAIGGLTKKLMGFRFKRDRVSNNEALVEAFADSVGLTTSKEIYDVNGTAFYFNSPRSITREQTTFGKEWLKQHFYKKNGTIRSGKNTENVPNFVLTMAKKVRGFKFVGVLGLRNSFGEYMQFLPIYRTFSGRSYFDYAPIHWGQPIILGFQWN